MILLPQGLFSLQKTGVGAMLYLLAAYTPRLTLSIRLSFTNRVSMSEVKRGRIPNSSVLTKISDLVRFLLEEFIQSNKSCWVLGNLLDLPPIVLSSSIL